MPSEHRQITFALEEIREAVTDLMGHHGVLPGHTQIVGLRITEVGDRVGAMVSVVVKETGKTRDLPLTEDLLGAALIRLCREAHIPLPRSAKKRLVRSGDGLSMHLNIAGTRKHQDRTAMADTPPEPAKAPAAAAKPKTAAPPADPTLPDYWSAMSRRNR